MEENKNQVLSDTHLESELNDFRAAIYQVKSEIQKVIVGQDKAIDLLFAAVFSGGHVLLEGVPGIAKTLLARLLAKSMSADFSRIQFTPDLMPTDIVGTSIFNMKSSEFVFKKGPIFSNIILIDEINRAPAKTQSALFEVMEEEQLSVDGSTYPMDVPFFVMATQNPIEYEGTYKLPEAQLDRFIFKIKLDYPSLEEEMKILQRFKEDFKKRSINDVQSCLDKKQILSYHSIIEKVQIRDEMIKYIAEITFATRNSGDLLLGASPRASLAVMKTAKAVAAINGRSFVTPDDIQYVVGPVLNHRLILTPDKELEGVSPEEVIKEIIDKIEVPR